MLVKRGRIYWADISLNHQRIRKSLKTDNKACAKKYHDLYQKEMWEEHYLNKRTNETWDNAVKTWKLTRSTKKSISKDIEIINFFSKYYRGKLLKDCDFNIALMEKMQEGRAGATINRYKAFLRSLCRAAKLEWEWVVPIPYFKFAKEYPRTYHLTEAEFESVLRNLPDKLKDVVAFAVETGLRKSNILQLDRRIVNVEESTCTFRGQQMKSGKPLTLPLSTKAMWLLRKNNYQFRFSAQHYRIYKDVLAKLGLSHITFHDLRHTFVYFKLQQGVPLEYISALLGHSTIQMTERYRHLTLKEIKKYV
jgi:integrase